MSSIDVGQTVSDDQPRKRPRPRPRPVISCLRCREKKLRCDRVTPCRNCTKAGCPSTCAFQNGVGNAAKRARSEVADQPVPGLGIIEDLQQRLRRVEERLSMAGGLEAHTGTTSPAPVVPSLPARPYLGTLGVKGTRTRYHGQNHRVTLLHQCEAAKSFLADNCNNDSPVFRLFRETQFIQRKSGVPANSPDSASEIDSSPELQELKRHLPPEDACGHLVALYLGNFEQTLRVLHRPTFRRQYAEWRNNPNAEDQLSLAFLPQLTAVLTIGWAMADEYYKEENPTAWDYLHKPAVDLVRAWLRNLSRKQRTDPMMLQTDVLITIARHLRGEPPEELWQATGALMRTAMVMGLHLDLSTCNNLSAYQRELRRRLWVTIAEMELQASISAGLPSSIPDVDFGPLTPSNLIDDDYDESTSELPLARPTTEVTDSLWLIILANSLPSRIRAMSSVHTAGFDGESPSAEELIRELEGRLQDMPVELKLNNSTRLGDGPGVAWNRALLDLFIRRPILCLLRLVLKRDADNFPSAYNSCLESSLSLLSYQDQFGLTTSAAKPRNPSAYWDLLFMFCKNDILQAALNVCEYMKFAPAPWPEPHTRASLSRIVERALDGLARTIDQPGSNMKDVLLLSVVLQHLRARGPDKAKSHQVQQGVMKALSVCREHLLSSWSEPAPTHTDVNQAPIEHFPSTGFTPLDNGAFTPGFAPQFSDFLGHSSALATEFSNFMNGSFDFDEGAFNEFFPTF
ncbi:hypothetical protein BJY04DRAFT_214753 [Aspergillus karnatakaensis]|uniref:Zn(II)2Cys6 transcription factor n=1 Tax=Aspergillus karnatakaensis TaxID=1810916 RepID=UPI003CCE195E